MENLGIDSKLLIAQAINFAIFFIVFKKFMAKPFTKLIDNEKKKQAEAEKALAEAKKLEESVEKKMSKMEDDKRKEMNQMVAEVKEEATTLKKQMMTEAHEEIKEMKEKAKKDMEHERTQLERDIQDKVLDLSFHIVNKVLKDVLPDESKKKITTAILKNLPKTSSLHEN